MGIAKKPPPIPKSPVKAPINNESSSNAHTGIFFSGLALSGALIIEYAAPSRTIENPTKIALSGIFVTIRLSPMLVSSPRAQIIKASLTNTSLLLNFGAKPDTAAKKTIANAAVVALIAEKSKRYSKMGTETIAPPAPIKPRTAPIKPPLITAVRTSDISTR